MADNVFVRLVPRNKQARPRLEAFGATLGPAVAQVFTPDAKQAQRASAELASRSVSVSQTPENRLECTLSPREFADLFGQKAVRVASPAEAAPNPAARMTKHETFMAPEAELVVPAALQDMIDFAYVPRPVEYHDVSYLPPMEDTYHLRLDSVVQALNAARCHRRQWTGRGVKVAMTDSGFARHPWFERGGYNIVRLSGPGADNPERDPSGHGTGESANILALAPDVTLICVKQGRSAAGDLETAIAENPDIITNSWGFSIDDRSKEDLRTSDPNMSNELVDIETIVAAAVAKGTIVCFSGGNGHLSFPACLPQVIAIGGVTVLQDGSLTASDYASSFHSLLYPGRQVPDFCGVVGSAAKSSDGTQPGHIMLPVPPGSRLEGENFAPRTGAGWGIFSGTSAASPQIAGVLALMRGINPKLTPDQARTILRTTAIDVTQGRSAMGDKASHGHDLATGSGLVDAFRACNSAAAMA